VVTINYKIDFSRDILPELRIMNEERGIGNIMMEPQQ